MQELIKNIENWAEERNLINGSTPQKQFIKLMEEFGELCAGVSKNKRELIIDSIGDCTVVVIILMKQLKIDNLNIIVAYEDADFSTENNEFICLRSSGVLGGVSNTFMYKMGDEYKPNLISYLYSFIYYISKIALNSELNLKDCLLAAYNEIKDRKGKMINGVFVKEADLGAKND